MPTYLVKFSRFNSFLTPEMPEKVTIPDDPATQLKLQYAAVTIFVPDDRIGCDEFIIKAAFEALAAANPSIPLRLSMGGR